VGDLVGTWMVLNVLENSNSSNIVSSVHENRRSILKFDEAIDVSSLKVKLDSIVLLDVGMRETDGSTVVGHDVWNFVLAKLLVSDLAKLERSFLTVNAVCLETSSNVVKDAEMLASLGYGNNVLEANWEFVVSSDFVIDLEVGRLVSANLDALLAGECILEPVTEKN